MPSRRCCVTPALPRRAVAATLASLSLLTPLLCQSIQLDIHVPLPQGCVEYHALLANRLLRQASESQSSSPTANDLQELTSGGDKDGEKVTSSSEEVNLFSQHTPHITLYLADFDLEEDDDDAHKGVESGSSGHDTAAKPLNQTKVIDFKNAISSLDFNAIIAGLRCPLSISKEESSADSYYNINGAYTMLVVQDTPCLRTLSSTLLHSLQTYLRRPVTVPSWVASLPEPARSAAIYRSRMYGSPNVLDGFDPHVTVGYDPTSNGSDSSSLHTRWRADAMERWNGMYERVRKSCMDEVQGIALAKAGVGGVVLANSRIGYWDLTTRSKDRGGNDGDLGLPHIIKSRG